MGYFKIKITRQRNIKTQNQRRKGEAGLINKKKQQQVAQHLHMKKQSIIRPNIT